VITKLRAEATKYVYSKLINLDHSYYIQNGTDKLGGYVDKYQNSICLIIQSYSLYIFPIVLFMIYSFKIFYIKNITLLFVVIGWLIGTIGLYSIFHKYKQKNNSLVVNELASISAFVHDSLNNFQLNTIYQLHSNHLKEISKDMNEFKRNEQKVFNLQGFFELVFTVVTLGLFIPVVVYSAGTADFAILFGLSKFFFYIIFYRIEWINANQLHWDNIVTIEKIISSLPQRTETTASSVSNKLQGNMIVENVEFHADNRVILKIPFLSIQKGEKIAIIGKTGSGKTYTMMGKDQDEHKGLLNRMF
jgi:ABC-type transport system involved in cytochrome bd biosynthesis fused ATPase/permease subunit